MKIKKIDKISEFTTNVKSLTQSEPTFYLLDIKDSSEQLDDLISALRDVAMEGVYVQIDNVELMQKLKANIESTLRLQDKTFNYNDNLLGDMQLLYRTCPYADFPDLEYKVSEKLGLNDKISGDLSIAYDQLIRWEIILRSKLNPVIDSNVARLFNIAWNNLSNKANSNSTQGGVADDANNFHARHFLSDDKLAINNSEYDLLVQLQSIQRFGVGIKGAVTKNGLMNAYQGSYSEHTKKLVERVNNDRDPEADDIKVLFKSDMLPLLTILHQKWPELITNTVLNNIDQFDLISSCDPECGAWVLQYLTPPGIIVEKIKNGLGDNFPEKSLVAVFLYLIAKDYTLTSKQFFSNLFDTQKTILRDHIKKNNYQILQIMDSNSDNFRAINAALFQDSLSKAELIQFVNKKMLITILSEMASISCSKIKSIWDRVSTRQQAKICLILIDFLQNHPDRIAGASFNSDWSFEHIFSTSDSKIALLKQANPDLTYRILSQASTESLKQPHNEVLKKQLKEYVNEFISAFKVLTPENKTILMSKLFFDDLGNESAVLSNIIKASRLYNADNIEQIPVPVENKRPRSFAMFSTNSHAHEQQPNVAKIQENEDKVQLLNASDKETYRELVDYDILVLLFQKIFEPDHILALLEKTKYPVTLFGAILKTSQTRENLDKYYTKISTHKNALLAHWFNDYDGKCYSRKYYNQSFFKGKYKTFDRLALESPVSAAWVYDNLFDCASRNSYTGLYIGASVFYVSLFSKEIQRLITADFIRDWYTYPEIILNAFYNKYKGYETTKTSYIEYFLICQGIEKIKSVDPNQEQPDINNIKGLVDSFAIKEIFALLDEHELNKIEELSKHITDDIVMLYYIHAEKSKGNDSYKGLKNLFKQDAFQNHERILKLFVYIEGDCKQNLNLHRIPSYISITKNIVDLLRYEAKYRAISANAGQGEDCIILYDSIWGRGTASVSGTPGKLTAYQKEEIKRLQDLYVDYVSEFLEENSEADNLRNENLLTIEKYDPGVEVGFFMSLISSTPPDNSPEARIEAARNKGFGFSCG